MRSTIHVIAPALPQRLRREPFARRRLPFHLCSLIAAVGVSVLSAPLTAQIAVAPDTTRFIVAARHAGRTDAASVLDTLLATARASNPRLVAARSRVEAAQALVGPAGARPDPMLMAALQNVPVSGPTFGTMMTMKMIGVSQMLPYPGKLALLTRAAEYERAAAESQRVAAELDVASEVERAFYDLAFADRALNIVRRNAGVLASLIAVADAKYRVGDGTQADVLRARVEAAHLGDQAAALVEQRRADLAGLNALLNRPSDTPVDDAELPARIVRAAVADSADRIHFVSAALGARAADSPLLPLDSLQMLGLRYSPTLTADNAKLAAQAARVALARKAYLPDVTVSLSYGERQGFPGMVSALVSIPIPFQKARKQDADIAGASAELAAMDAERSDAANTLRATIAQQVSAVERARTDLALYVTAIVPQAQATLASATASYQVARVDFTTVIDAQATLFNYEIAYNRALTDFAKAVAALHRTVGTEVLR
ncbi:MAG TPA: TolC family protein [Gemmatimonadaceae bacterium]